MDLKWIPEPEARWDEGKARIVGDAPVGVFDRRFKECEIGSIIPGDWWRVDKDGETVGYGWMDVEWGDAEILLATAPAEQGKGIGAFILTQLENEARTRGLNYVYNTIRPTHPEREKVARFLGEHGFTGSEDGSLFRAATKPA